MRIPLTEYAVKEIIAFAGALLLLAVAAWLYIHPAAAVVPLVLCAFVIGFFRDPERGVPPDRGDLVAPADGTVMDIVDLYDPDFLKCEVLRIGIFLSIFDVHLNRAPCSGSVESVQYRRGTFHDARNARAESENEALTVALYCAEHQLRVAVRQIAGAIARRIVCRLKPGASIGRGDRYGMIKFGSRTELLIPADRVAEIAVQVGSKVRAGSTVLARIRRVEDPRRAGNEEGKSR